MGAVLLSIFNIHLCDRERGSRRLLRDRFVGVVGGLADDRASVFLLWTCIFFISNIILAVSFLSYYVSKPFSGALFHFTILLFLSLLLLHEACVFSPSVCYFYLRISQQLLPYLVEVN